MAVETTTASNPLVTSVIVDREANLTVETISTSSQTLFAVEIINPNTDSAVYVHLIDTANAATTATQHDNQFYCPANTSCYYYFPNGFAIAAGIKFYTSTSAGGGQASSAPTNPVTVKLGFS